MKNLVRVSFVLALVAAFFVHIRAAHHVPDWGNGMAPFAFALMGDMPYGASREAAFRRLVSEVNRDNDVDFVMHAGDYQRALPGSEHGRQWTKSGCLLLVTCSLSDEMM